MPWCIFLQDDIQEEHLCYALSQLSQSSSPPRAQWQTTNKLIYHALHTYSFYQNVINQLALKPSWYLCHKRRVSTRLGRAARLLSVDTSGRMRRKKRRFHSWKWKNQQHTQRPSAISSHGYITLHILWFINCSMIAVMWLLWCVALGISVEIRQNEADNSTNTKWIRFNLEKSWFVLETDSFFSAAHFLIFL